MDVNSKRELIQGYVFFVIGFIVGWNTHDWIHYTPLACAFLIGYAFWAEYWGIKIVRPYINNLGKNLHFTSLTIRGAVENAFTMIFLKSFIIFVAGYLVGALGGAIYMQVTLMKVK